jgi:hypothetical protein
MAYLDHQLELRGGRYPLAELAHIGHTDTTTMDTERRLLAHQVVEEFKRVNRQSTTYKGGQEWD